MRVHWLRANSDTGGDGDLTLSNIAGSPNYMDKFGTAGSRLVEYDIIQWADATKGPKAKSESGVGFINLATGVLTRTAPEETFDASGPAYKPNMAGDVAEALVFSADPTLVEIFCSPHANAFAPYPPFVNDQSGNGFPPLGTQSTDGGEEFQMEINGALYTFPVVISARLSVISKISCRLTTPSTDSVVTSLLCGLYEVDAVGNAGKLLANFGDIGPLTSVATLLGTLTNPIPNPGAFYIGLLPNADGTEKIKLAAAGNAYNPGQGINYSTPSTWKILYQTQWGQSLTDLPDPAAPISNNNTTTMPLFGIG